MRSQEIPVAVPERTRNATGRSSNARCNCRSWRKVTMPTVMVKMITVRLSVTPLEFSPSTPSFPKMAVRPAKKSRAKCKQLPGNYGLLVFTSA